MGSSGRSTGTHVHFEVLRDGKSVNPMSYVRAAR
jgi:murein DD-endopeptidase MepM/ murein hydrolase activator NlpD